MKRFLVTLGISVGVWLVSVFIQFFTLYNVKFTLFSSNACQITGFPIAQCIYSSSDQLPFWLIDFANIFFWFWVIHLFWNWVDKGKSKS